MLALVMAVALILAPASAMADQDWAGGLDVPAVQDILLEATAEGSGTSLAAAALPDELSWLRALSSREIGPNSFDLRHYIEGIAYFGPILRQLSALPEAEQTAITSQVFTETTGEGLSEAAIALLRDLRAPEALIIEILEEAKANGANRIQLRGYPVALDRYRELGDIGSSTMGYIVDKAPQAGAMLPIWQLAEAVTARQEAVTARQEATRRAADALERAANALDRMVEELGISDD